MAYERLLVVQMVSDTSISATNSYQSGFGNTHFEFARQGVEVLGVQANERGAFGLGQVVPGQRVVIRERLDADPARGGYPLPATWNGCWVTCGRNRPCT